MIIEMTQELSWRNDSMMQTNVISNGQIVGSFQAPYISREDRRSNGLLQFQGTYHSQHTYHINFSHIPCPIGYTDEMFTYSRKDSAAKRKYHMMKMAYEITKDDHPFTQIYTIREDIIKKFSFFQPQSLDYYLWQLGSDTYQCYHVTKDGMGIWYCVYKNGSLIAEIQKSMKVTNCLYNHKMYLANYEDIDILSMITGILQCKHYEYGKRIQGINNHRESLPNELRQEMLAKFNPDFVEQMKSLS